MLNHTSGMVDVEDYEWDARGARSSIQTSIEHLRTTGHVGSPARVCDVYPYNRRHAPSSTLNSSVDEMVSWMLVNLNRGEVRGHRILRPESYDLLWQPTTDTSRAGRQVGLSWFLGEVQGHRTVSQGGSDTGLRSFIVLLPDDGIGVVVASNWSGTDTEALSHGIVELVLGGR